MLSASTSRSSPPGTSSVVVRCLGWMLCGVLGGCEARAEPPSAAHEPAPRLERAAPERALGVEDRGIFSDLDARLQLALPAHLDEARLHALHDRRRSLLVLYGGEWPIKVYPVREDARNASPIRSVTCLAVSACAPTW